MENAIGKIENINGGDTGSTEEPETGIDFGNMTEDEITNNYVGKYVDYTPDVGTFSDHVGTTYNGYSASPENTEISTITTLKWRILDVENNILTLISDTTANTNFGLGGADGYNNGVLLLNNACKAIYSNSLLGATGRSLNIDDIEKHMTYDKTSYTNGSYKYGNEYSPSYRSYPVIYAEEKTGAPNGTYGTKYDLSEQDEPKTGRASGNELFKGKWTYYAFTMGTSTMKNEIYVELFSSTQRTWLASRCVDPHNDYAYFCLFYVNGNTVDADWLCSSDHDNYYGSYEIYPVVEIDLTKVNVGLTGTGADGDGYSLTLK